MSDGVPRALHLTYIHPHIQSVEVESAAHAHYGRSEHVWPSSGTETFGPALVGEIRFAGTRVYGRNTTFMGDNPASPIVRPGSTVYAMVAASGLSGFHDGFRQRIYAQPSVRYFPRDQNSSLVAENRTAEEPGEQNEPRGQAAQSDCASLPVAAE